MTSAPASIYERWIRSTLSGWLRLYASGQVSNPSEYKMVPIAPSATKTLSFNCVRN